MTAEAPPLTLDELLAMARRGQEDPVWWVRNVLGDDPWDIQGQILESVRDNRRTSVRSCHSMGKSWTAARVALWFASCFVPSVVITTAPTFRQVKKIIWQEMRKAHTASRVPLGGTMLQTEWQIADKWYAFGFATDDPDAFQGIHSDHVLLIMDEAAGVPIPLWTSSDSLLASGKVTRLLAIANPTEPAGPFFDECRAKGTHSMKVGAFDTPNFTAFGITLDDIKRGTWEAKIGGVALPRPHLISPEWVAEKYARWGDASPMFISRILADFPQSAHDTLIPLAWIEAAVARELQRGDPHQLAVDVARYGEDSTACWERWGDVARLYFRLDKHSTMETVGYVARRQNESEPGVVAKIDPIGLGSGVVDRLHELGHLVAEANVSRGARDKELFERCRDEWYWELRQRFDPSYGESNIDIEGDPDLMAQLSSLKYKILSSGKIKIESKQEMVDRGLVSPNDADALMMLMASHGVIMAADLEKQATRNGPKRSVFGSSVRRVNRNGGIL